MVNCMSYVFMIAISEEFFSKLGLGFHENPRSINCTGNIGKPKVQMFLIKKTRSTTTPGIINFKFVFKITKLYKAPKSGSQIIVGFRANTKTENANNKEAFLLWFKYSLRTIKAIAITGKSGLGDCENRKRTGRKRRWIQDFFSKI